MIFPRELLKIQTRSNLNFHDIESIHSNHYQTEVPELEPHSISPTYRQKLHPARILRFQTLVDRLYFCTMMAVVLHHGNFYGTSSTSESLHCMVWANTVGSNQPWMGCLVEGVWWWQTQKYPVSSSVTACPKCTTRYITILSVMLLNSGFMSLTAWDVFSFYVLRRHSRPILVLFWMKCAKLHKESYIIIMACFLNQSIFIFTAPVISWHSIIGAVSGPYFNLIIHTLFFPSQYMLAHYSATGFLMHTDNRCLKPKMCS